VALARLVVLVLEDRPQLSVDVEGWELEVLAGLDFRKYRPKVLIVENLFNETTYRTRIAEYGYLLWQFVWPNDVYVAREAS